MEIFKTIDIRGLSFFSALQLASQEFGHIKKNGILEIIVDKKRTITDALSKWAKTQGYKISDIEDGSQMVRLLIHKSSRTVKV